MSEAFLARITIFDDAQADLFETDNHGRLFLIEGTRNLCMSGGTFKRLQFKLEGSLTFATDHSITLAQAFKLDNSSFFHAFFLNREYWEVLLKYQSTSCCSRWIAYFSNY